MDKVKMYGTTVEKKLTVGNFSFLFITIQNVFEFETSKDLTRLPFRIRHLFL
jgi:hypothetical protein